MRDLLPIDAEKMRYIEQVSREISKLFGYDEIITPILESYELLAAKTSEEIRERMYTFKDLGGRKVAMRPEFTASVARLISTRMRNEPKPIRFFSVGSLYRYDEPQYGRYREFWQSNYELFGSDKPEADAEILILTNNFLEKLGLKNYRFKIGHTGILRGFLNQEGLNDEKQNTLRQLIDKKSWEEAFKFAEGTNLSQKCLVVLKQLFEIKGEDAFKVLENIKETLAKYEESINAVNNLWNIIKLVEDSNEKIDVTVEAGFARGLEYYTGMIFESYVPKLEIALGGGGRYDKLIQLFGGEPIPAVGVAQGLDRISLALKKQKVRIKSDKNVKIAVISVKDETMANAMEISALLRNSGFMVETAVMGRSVSKALADANRRKVTHAVIIGPKELNVGKVVLREMKNSTQKTVLFNKLTEEILVN
ncbi:MAG: histidine--tRNA ligase [Candidatus Bathyarchaeota archaeon]